MWEQLGLNIALSGLFTVFSALVLIALVIHLFNQFFTRFFRKEVLEPEKENGEKEIKIAFAQLEKIPEDHLAAIAVAIEFYRRIHYDELQSEITFERSDIHSVWKMGYRFGQRSQSVR